VCHTDLPNKQRQLNAASDENVAETGTKTGKILTLPCWLLKALLKGEVSGPYFSAACASFSETKNLSSLHCESHHP